MRSSTYSLIVSIVTIGMLLSGCSSNTTPASNQTPKQKQGKTTFAHYNPDPIKKIAHFDAAHMQMHFFDHADSVWIDGDWHDTKTNLYGSRYVFTYVTAQGEHQKSVVEELDLDRDTGYKNYVCPKLIGHITITSIDTTGPKEWMLIHFDSSSGVTGTLDLSNNRWEFSTTN